MKADSNQLSAGALEGAPEFYGVVGPKEYRMQFQVKGKITF